MLIVSLHSYCAHKFTCHVIHRACALSTKINNDRAAGHCYSFACSVTPTFLFRNRFYLQLSSHCPKINKKSVVNQISNIFSPGPHTQSQMDPGVLRYGRIGPRLCEPVGHERIYSIAAGRRVGRNLLARV